MAQQAQQQVAEQQVKSEGVIESSNGEQMDTSGEGKKLPWQNKTLNSK